MTKAERNPNDGTRNAARVVPPLMWLLVLTAACLLPFVKKAFHIDDTLFLRAAEQIQKTVRRLPVQPIPLRDVRPEAPPAVSKILAKCLAKRPGDRWQSADHRRRQANGRLGNIKTARPLWEANA